MRGVRGVEAWRCGSLGLEIWGIVKIMVPFWVPVIIRGLIRGLI